MAERIPCMLDAGCALHAFSLRRVHTCVFIFASVGEELVCAASVIVSPLHVIVFCNISVCDDRQVAMNRKWVLSWPVACSTTPCHHLDNCLIANVGEEYISV